MHRHQPQVREIMANVPADDQDDDSDEIKAENYIYNLSSKLLTYK